MAFTHPPKRPNERGRARVAVIGAGEVGSAFAFAMTIHGLARELAIINRSAPRAEGQAMDLNHAMALATPMTIEGGDDYALCAGAEVVVITAGAAQKPGETRLDLARRNATIIRGITEQIMKHNPSPILVVVTNPVDVMTQVVLEASGLPPGRVLGSGTVLDSARFRYQLAGHCSVDPRNMHCHIVGEHGDSELPLWSRVNVSGVGLNELCSVCDRGCSTGTLDEIEKNVRNAAYEIIERKGSTCYGIALALVRIVGAILRDERSVLTVSAPMEGQYGIEGVCLSLPRIVGASGIEGVIPAPLADNEREELLRSAEVVRQSLDSVRD